MNNCNEINQLYILKHNLIVGFTDLSDKDITLGDALAKFMHFQIDHGTRENCNTELIILEEAMSYFPEIQFFQLGKPLSSVFDIINKKIEELVNEDKIKEKIKRKYNS